MATTERDLAAELQAAKDKAARVYRDYKASQDAFIPPVAHISVDTTDENHTIVHIDTTYQETNFHFESVKPEDADIIQQYLNGQRLVREKYASGQTVSLEATQNRAKQFDGRFNPKCSDGLYLYSGFMVTDADTGSFLGLANTGSSGKGDGHAEIAFLNRPDAWSTLPATIVEEYAIPERDRLTKSYKGLATAEVCTLMQYSEYLRRTGHEIQGKDLVGINATARLDNPGSWKACAKTGMDLVDIDVNESYGPHLRYQLCRKI